MFLMILSTIVVLSTEQVHGDYCRGSPDEIDVGKHGCVIILSEEENKVYVWKDGYNRYHVDRNKARQMCKEKYQSWLFLPKSNNATWAAAAALLKKYTISIGVIPAGIVSRVKHADATITITWEDGDVSKSELIWFEFYNGKPPFVTFGSPLVPGGNPVATIDELEDGDTTDYPIYVVCHRTATAPTATRLTSTPPTASPPTATPPTATQLTAAPLTATPPTATAVSSTGYRAAPTANTENTALVSVTLTMPILLGHIKMV